MITQQQIETLKAHCKEIGKLKDCEAYYIRRTDLEPSESHICTVQLFDTPRLAYEHFLTTIDNGKV